MLRTWLDSIGLGLERFMDWLNRCGFHRIEVCDSRCWLDRGGCVSAWFRRWLAARAGAVAARFGVAVSSVVKWSQRYRATGSVAPGKMDGHRKRVLEPHRAFIKERISQTPHLTIIKAAGARLWYLPPYSPDLSPIEQTFSKIKHWLRLPQSAGLSRSFTSRQITLV